MTKFLRRAALLLAPWAWRRYRASRRTRTSSAAR